MIIKTQLRAGGISIDHNAVMRHEPDRRATSLKRLMRAIGRKGHRLEFLVVRAGMRTSEGRIAKR